MKQNQQDQPGRKLRILRANPIARMSPSRVQQFLSTRESAYWPRHLRNVLTLLDKQRVPQQEAKGIIVKSAAAGLTCAQLHQAQLLAGARRETQITMRKLCTATANHLTYLRARPLRKLDHDITALLKNPVIDLEILEEILGLVARSMIRVPHKKRSKVLTAAIKGKQHKDFHSLHPIVLQKCYDSLQSLAIRTHTGAISAERVLKLLAKTLRCGEPVNSKPYEQERRFVAALQPIVRPVGFGIEPVTKFLYPDAQENFLRFANLIYAGAKEFIAERGAAGHLQYRPKAGAEAVLAQFRENRPSEIELITSDCLRKSLFSES